MASATVKVVGFNPILRKLGEGGRVTDEEKASIMRAAAVETAGSLRPTVPRLTGASVSKMTVVANDNRAKVTLPAIPLRFVDLGTKRRGGGVRIRARRFMAKERRKVPPRLRDGVNRAVNRLLRWWPL
jgi:ribosomal protein S30